ncbi:Bud site selection protein 6 [Pseudocyphellaria aurata]|nr:Bud site selection protein 6 [Pseudocyphellaria aurata]
MQALSNSQRSTQRRSPAVDTSVPPQPSAMSASPSQSTAGARSSSGSARSSATRRQNPSQQLSQIEKSVTHLLIATKQLLETLTQWSRHTATEGEVSDVYVRLGYEFNIACRAFTSIGVDTSDLGPVPELLRAILEETLSQEACSASLDRFLPKIRDIIITLLHGLKRKQQKLRSKQNNGSSASVGSSGSLNSGLNQMLDDVPGKGSGSNRTGQRVGSGASTLTGDFIQGDTPVGDEQAVPPRFSSIHSGRQNSGSVTVDTTNRTINREAPRSFPTLPVDSTPSTPSSATTPVNPVQSLRSEVERPPMQRAGSQRSHETYRQPPPPPPKEQDALAELQKSSDLERRASRRYSAYQISKHLGASPNGVPMIPPAQNSPIPNRGRDVRESMNAVRVRGSGIHTRQRSNNQTGEPTTGRNHHFAHRISEESSQSSDSPDFKPPTEPLPDDSPIIKTPEDKLRVVDPGLEAFHPSHDTTWPQTAKYGPTFGASELSSAEPANPLDRTIGQQGRREYTNETHGHPMDLSQEHPFIPEHSPQPNRELTLFLQYKSKIKKFVLPEGASELSVARLQLAFIEKFAWSTHNNGNDLPEIYIQDPVSGVRHELEDLSDVKDRSVLVLNVEVLDEVKRHIDEGLGGLRRMVEGVRSIVDGQQSVMQRVSDHQQDVTKEIARLATSPKAVASRITSFEKPKANGIRVTASPKDKNTQIAGVQSLRQDLAVVRQTFSSLVSDLDSSIATVNSKASSIKAMTFDGATFAFDSSSGRSHVNAGKKLLGEDSEKIVNRVDDLQDIVEDLRKDVVSRGVRPLPRQLETVSKSISTATAELKKMQEYLKREKPVWTKIWEQELSLVCSDRDLLTMQEELAADLEDDLEKATQTFALVEQATKQQNVQPGQSGNGNLRTTSKGLTAINTDQDFDPVKAKDGVLGEVRALRPNHETRLEAIERAEKARQKELESRREGEFTKELGNFVEEGRLKKSGGVEEAERQRKAKDEKNRREAWEKQQENVSSKAKGAENEVATSEQADDPLVQEASTAKEPEFAEAPEQPIVETETPQESGGHS